MKGKWGISLKNKQSYQPPVSLNEEPIFRSIKEQPEYDRLRELGKKTDLRKRLLREGFTEEQLEGKQMSELKGMLEGLNDSE